MVKFKQIITFVINDILMGIDVFKIDKIIKFENLIDLPEKKTDYLIGMIRIEDEIISVISLRKRLRLKDYQGKKQKIVVIDYNQNLIGFLVDDVRKLVEYSDETEIKEEKLFGLPGELFQGKLERNDETIYILNIFKLIEYQGELGFIKPKARKKKKSTGKSKKKKEKKVKKTSKKSKGK